VVVHDFQAGRFNNVARLSGSQIGTAGAVRGAMPFTPSAQHLNFTDRQTGFRPQTANTAFFRHQQPAPVQHLDVVRNVGTPGGGQRFGTPQGGQNPQNPVRGGDNGGFRRFGAPAGQGGMPAVNQPQQRVERNGFGAGNPNTAPRNDRPMPKAPNQSQRQMNQTAPRNDRGGWNRFGAPGNGAPQAPPPAHRQNTPSDRPRFDA